MKYTSRIVPPFRITLFTVIATPGWAAISNTSPSKGQRVTVDATPPNPAKDKIGSSADNVTVKVEQIASIDTSTKFLTPAISAGGGNWTVNNAGKVVSNYDGIIFDGSNGRVINQVTGTIDAQGGVSFGSDHTKEVTNAGTITSGQHFGVAMGPAASSPTRPAPRSAAATTLSSYTVPVM